MKVRELSTNEDCEATSAARSVIGAKETHWKSFDGFLESPHRRSLMGVESLRGSAEFASLVLCFDEMRYVRITLWREANDLCESSASASARRTKSDETNAQTAIHTE